MAQKTDFHNSNMLFNYYIENTKFSYDKAHAAVLDHSIDNRTNSIQSVIHECISKGYFKKNSEGAYILSRESPNGEIMTCLLINGDNRDLSNFEDDSIDAIIIDRPEHVNHLKLDIFGKNKNLPYIASQKEYIDKQRVLKPGRFAIEIIPQSNINDYEWFCKSKNNARRGGLNYYDKLLWNKKIPGINQILGQEKVLLFSKGAPRDFYFQSEKNKVVNQDSLRLPTVFDYGKTHQYGTSLDIVVQILQFISSEDTSFHKDKYLDYSSMVENSFRVVNNTVIEKNADIHYELFNNIAALKEINTATPNMKIAINVAIDALEAFYEGPEAFDIFEKHQLYFGMPLNDAVRELKKLPKFNNSKLNESIDIAVNIMEKKKNHPDIYYRSKKYWDERINRPHTLECSARGDRRFSSSHVKLKINGTEKTIEEWFNSSKRNNYGKPVNKGDPFDYIIDPFTKDKLYTKEEQEDMYIGLWITYLSLNPDLVTYASKFSNFTDSKHSFRTPFKTSDIISEYVNNKDRYVNTIKSGKWYKNMKNKRNSSIDKKSSVLKERTRDSLAIEK